MLRMSMFFVLTNQTKYMKRLKSYIRNLFLKPLTCPKCGNKTNFGFPPCCVGEVDKHATCYNCGEIFEYNKSKTLI